MNDKLIIEKVKQLKETAINNQSNWQFPNEHYIEATGMIIALNDRITYRKGNADKEWSIDEVWKYWNENIFLNDKKIS
jgi:hypothetical protein